MKNELVLATRNDDKVKEIRELLSALNLDVVTLKKYPDAPVVVEDGKTLEENASKKAEVIANYTGKTTIADDTGLEVDYLNGAPGVLSSRYAGEQASYADNVAKLLKELEGIPREQRGAKFRCIVTVCNNHESVHVEGICNGIILAEPRGKDGFGYDPVFYVPEFGCTFAEMDLELKNQISHRARAFLKIRELIKEGEIKI